MALPLKRPHARRAALLAGIALCGLVLLSTIVPARAASHALLIGVSDYKNAKFPSLSGPKSDVALMWRALLVRGVARERITVLADSLADDKDGPVAKALPTREAILAALDALPGRVRATPEPNDLVIIYFSGHGTFRKQSAADAQVSGDVEPDGMDEVFLPIDIGRQDFRTGAPVNGIIDDEIRVRLDAIRDAGALVWAILDSCHSGDMTRGADSGAQVRFVPPSVLGLDAGPATTRGGPPKRLARPYEWLPEGGAPGLVVFTATRAYQRAIEKPRAELDNLSVGVFTYHLTRAIIGYPNASFAELSRAIERDYETNDPAAPAPVFEGDLSRVPFGDGTAGGQAWTARKAGERLHIDAGRLSGFDVGAKPTVHALGAHDTHLARAEILRAGITASEAKLIAEDGTAPGRLPRDLTVRLAERTVDLTVKVALPRPADREPSARCGAPSRAAFAAIEALSATSETVAVPVAWVAHDSSEANIYLHVCGARIFLLPSSGALAMSDRRPQPVVEVGGDQAQAVDRLQDALWRAVRQHNLLKLAHGLPRSAAAGRVHVELKVERQAPAAARALGERRACKGAPVRNRIPETALPVKAGARPVFTHCDRLYVKVSSSGAKPVDVTVLYMDSAFGVQHFKHRRIRMEKLGSERGLIFPIDILTWCPKGATGCGPAGPMTVGTERLLVIAVERESEDSKPKSYGFLAQPSLKAAAKTRGGAGGGGEPDAFGALLADAALTPGAGTVKTRGGRRALDKVPLENVSLTLLGWEVVPPSEMAAAPVKPAR